jgi:subtilisin-like proprotein convertase family protein
VPTPTTGRFAFHYFVSDGGPSGANSNYIGVDEVFYGAPCSGAPTPGNTLSSVASVCPTIPFNLSLQNPPTGLGTTYQWQTSPDGTTWTNVPTGGTNATLTTSLTAATYYRANVTCGTFTTASTPVQVTLNAPLACYCLPTSSCTFSDVITNVTFGSSLNNNSTCAATGYTNYTTTVAATDVITGGASSMKVTVGPGGTEYVGVWIDYNRSGSFEASEFTLLGSGNGTTITGNIAVPSTAPLGQTRMRVRVRWATTLTGTDACTIYTYGETEDYTVNLIPCVPVTLTTQPANKVVDCGGNTSFAVTAAGSIPAFYWEYRTSAAGLWQNVPNAAPYSGVTTNTLTITSATSNLNGYQYRAVFSGACVGVDFSTPATLTVNPLVAAIAKTPAGNICLGSIQQLSVTNTQPATVLTFSSAPALNITIPDNGTTPGVNNTIAVSGIPAGVLITSIKIKMDLTHSWAGDMIVVAKAPNNKILNLAYALNATGGASGTTAFRPTFSSTLTPAAYLNSGANPYASTFSADGYDATTGDPTIPTGPDGYIPTSVAATRNTFADLYTAAANSSTLNGNWVLAMYDYYDDGTITNKFNNWSIEITYTGGLANGVWTSPAPNSLYTDAAATILYNGTTPINTVYAKPTTAGVTNYTVVVDNGVCTSAPFTVPVTANVAATAATAVANKAICVLGNTSFTSVVTVGSGNTYQWQVSTDGGATFANIADGAVYSGTTTTTLSLTAAPQSYNNNRYRLVVSALPCATVITSAAGTLTVNPNPVIVVSANPVTELYPGLTTTLSAAVSPNPAATYTWYRNNVIVPGATANTLVVDIDKLGTYKVTVNDVNGCNNTSASITIKEAANSILFIYPSPNTGQFQVRYFSELGSTQYPRTLSVYDSKGARVFTKSYSINSPYTRMDVDLKNHAKGVYNVELTDYNGDRIKTGRVVIF